MIVRPAISADAQALCDILNPLIVAGGTTAHATPFDPDRMVAHYIAPPVGIACHVAVTEDGIVGFQALKWPGPTTGIPDDWGSIATFVAPGQAGRGIGRALFDATRTAAIAAGVATIDATIRADNDSGLTYYTALGFQDYDRQVDVPLSDGRLVDRVRKRFDLPHPD